MGLFTTKCSACGERVRRGLKFCPHCGVAGAATISCRSCGQSLKVGLKFCSHCGAKTEVDSTIANDRWARQPGDFAVRIDASAVPVNTWWRDRQLTVEHGTRAMIFQAGQFKGEVPEGRYDMGGFVQRLNHFMVDQGMVAILVDAGDVTLDLENGGFRTADGFDVNTRSRLVLRATDPDALFVNMMKGKSLVKVSDPGGKNDLESELADEVQMVLAAIVSRYRADALFDSLPRRDELESQLRAAISVTLSRLGLTLIQLRFIGFEGEAYAKFAKRRSNLQVAEAEGQVELDENRLKNRLRQTGERENLAVAQADADLEGDRAKLNSRLRALLTQDRLDTFKNETDFQQFVRQTEHELGLKDVVRDNELTALTERFAVDRDRERLLRRIEAEGIADAARHESEWKQLVADERVHDEKQTRILRRQLDEMRGNLDRRKIELEIERLDHAEELRRQEVESDLRQKQRHADIDALRQVKQMEGDEDRLEQELEAKKLAARSQASTAALLSIADGPVAEQLIALEKVRSQEKMSPEQLLALAAQTNPEAAKALAGRYAAEGVISSQRAELLERQLADQKNMTGDYADRMERLMQTALGQMGQVATSRAQPVEPRQTVINNAPSAAKRCRACAAEVSRTEAFCGQCGAATA